MSISRQLGRVAVIANPRNRFAGQEVVVLSEKPKTYFVRLLNAEKSFDERFPPSKIVTSAGGATVNFLIPKADLRFTRRTAPTLIDNWQAEALSYMGLTRKAAYAKWLRREPDLETRFLRESLLAKRRASPCLRPPCRNSPKAKRRFTQR